MIIIFISCVRRRQLPTEEAIILSRDKSNVERKEETLEHWHSEASFTHEHVELHLKDYATNQIIQKRLLISNARKLILKTNQLIMTAFSTVRRA